MAPPGPSTQAAAYLATKSRKTMAGGVASQVSVRDLKTHLSAWLARAQAGVNPPGSEGDRCRHRQLEWPEARVPTAAQVAHP